MPPKATKKDKKKSSGGAAGNKKGKKGKKTKEPEVTFQQALIGYRVTLKEQQLEELKYERRNLEEKVSRTRVKLEHLQEEQAALFHHLLREAREMEDKLTNEEKIGKESVTRTLFDMWQAGKDEDNQLKDLRRKIRDTESRTAVMADEVEHWKNFRDVVHGERESDLQQSERELRTVNETFEQMCAFLKNDLERTKAKIETDTRNTVVAAKEQASQAAVVNMDKYDKLEVVDNNYLKLEAEKHRIAYLKLAREVEELEKRNLDIMAVLFECRRDDLRFSRDFFIQSVDIDAEEDLQSNGLLEIDLRKANLVPSKFRPKSAMQAAVEKKIASLSFIEDEGYEDTEEEKIEAISTDWLSNEDLDEALKLGPLSMKLMNVRGNNMVLQAAPSPMTCTPIPNSAAAQREAGWPVSPNMLRKLVEQV